jgi:hypothetical protein
MLRVARHADSKLTWCYSQEATVSLLSAQAFTEQLATGHGPSGPEGGFDGRDGRRTVDRGLLTGSGATTAAVVTA